MDLEAARALKAEVAEQVVRPVVAEVRSRRTYDVPACSLERVTGVEAGIALGIAAGTRPGDYRLAVRVQRRALEVEAQLREGIDAATRREADFRYIGRVAKDSLRAAAPAPWHQSRQRPLLIGVSVGHVSVTAGTLGAFVLHRATGRQAILSNNHVLANENAADLGDAILQPGAYDGGAPDRDRIGSLLDFVPLETGADNLVDAAVAGLDDGIGFDARTLTGIGALGGLRTELLEPGTRVAKVGRTTGTTQGVVTAIELDQVVVTYERGDLSFDRQIEIEGLTGLPFSAGGDSGSLIVDGNGMACGLLFAGSDQGGAQGRGLTYANELAPALERLDLDLASGPLIA